MNCILDTDAEMNLIREEVLNTEWLEVVRI